MQGNPGWGVVVGTNQRVTNSVLSTYYNHQLVDVLTRQHTVSAIETLPLHRLPPTINDFAKRSLKGRSLRADDVFRIQKASLSSKDRAVEVKGKKQLAGSTRVRQVQDGFHTLLCEPFLETGIHYLEVLFVRKGADAKFENYIGIVDEKVEAKHLKGKTVAQVGWAIGMDGAKHRQGARVSYMGKNFDVNDLVQVEVDMTNKSIRFAYNSQWYSMAYDQINVKKARFAITMRYPGTTIEVRCKSSFGFGIDTLNFKDYSLNKLALEKKSSSMSIARVLPQLQEGRQEFEVRVGQLSELGEARSEEGKLRHIGIIKPNVTNFTNSTVGSVGWALLSNGRVMNHGVVKKYTDPLKAGDVVTAHIDTEAGTLSFSINGGPNLGDAFKNIPSVFYAAISLSTIGDRMELLHVTLPKPKLAAVGQGSGGGDTEQELRLLSDIPDGLGMEAAVERELRNPGKFVPINLEKAAKKISSAFFDVKGNMLKKTQSRRYTAVLEEPLYFGKRYWTLRMSNIENPGTTSQNYIGIVDADARALNVNSSLGSCGWAITCVGDKIVKVAKDKQMGAYALNTSFGPNDLVQVAVDMEKREMSFCINGRDLGVAFTDLPERIFPAFSMDAPNWSMEVVKQGKDFLLDSLRRGKVSLFNGGRTALIASDQWQTVHGDKEFIPNSGAYTWEFKLHDFDLERSESLVVGIVPANQSYLQLDPIALNLQGYGLVLNTARKQRVRFKGVAQPYGEKKGISGFVPGDTVGVCWDSKQGTMEFFKNGVSLGVAFSELDTTIRYRPAVSAVGRARFTLTAPIPLNITWKSDSFGDNFMLDKQSMKLVKTSPGRATAVAEAELTRGVHNWRIMYEAPPTSPAMNNFVGVIDTKKAATAKVVGEKYLGLIGYAVSTAGFRYNNGKSTQYMGTQRAGDVIDVHLDMDSRTMRFSLNGVDCGPAFTDLPESVRPAISMQFAETSCHVLSNLDAKTEQKNQAKSIEEEIDTIMFEQKGDLKEAEVVEPLRWSQTRKHNRITLEMGDSYAKMESNNSSCSTVLTDEVFTTGIHKFDIKVTAGQATAKRNFMLGIVPEDHNLNVSGNDYVGNSRMKGYGIYLSTSSWNCYHKDNPKSLNDPNCKGNQFESATIGVVLNMDERKVTFFRDGCEGTPINKAFYENIQGGPGFRACLSLFGGEGSITRVDGKMSGPEQFNPEAKGPQIALTDENSSVSSMSMSHSWNTVYGSKLARQGLHIWKIRVDRYLAMAQGNNWWCIVGVASSIHNTMSYLSNHGSGFGYILQGMRTDGNSAVKYGKPVKAGDEIVVVLDLSKGTLRFKLNGESLGTSHSNIPKGSYRLAVSLGHRDTQLTLLGHLADSSVTGEFFDPIKHGAGVMISESGNSATFGGSVWSTAQGSTVC
eukprot:jgi/Bigna1/133148/aug1.20_g7856